MEDWAGKAGCIAVSTGRGQGRDGGRAYRYLNFALEGLNLDCLESTGTPSLGAMLINICWGDKWVPSPARGTLPWKQECGGSHGTWQHT